LQRPVCPSDQTFAFRPGGIPARNAKGERLLLYSGIIDILQSYRFKKKLEHGFKSIVMDGVRDGGGGEQRIRLDNGWVAAIDHSFEGNVT